jgi:hypothetical protein
MRNATPLTFFAVGFAFLIGCRETSEPTRPTRPQSSPSDPTAQRLQEHCFAAYLEYFPLKNDKETSCRMFERFGPILSKKPEAGSSGDRSLREMAEEYRADCEFFTVALKTALPAFNSLEKACTNESLWTFSVFEREPESGFFREDSIAAFLSQTDCARVEGVVRRRGKPTKRCSPWHPLLLKPKSNAHSLPVRVNPGG